MTALLGIALLFLVVAIWAYAERHDLDPFGEDDDDSQYVDPARPHVVGSFGPTPTVAGLAEGAPAISASGRVSRRELELALPDRSDESEESGYRTTSLRLVK